ncbi:MAG TPA: DUF3916 domain-containing protein [Planctomycetes bacterium]|nr:DUF3916 domain-containing protein [Planctomycetota bacterium]
MRRISVQRPKEKLRGIKRRLKALDKWSESLIGFFPTEYANEKYWNWKIPILDRMVNRPTTNKGIQAHCARAILRAASSIEKAKPENMKDAIVSALLTYPDMFDSEICVFFCNDYFSNFFIRNSENQKLIKLERGSLLSELGITSINGFEETGFHFVMKDRLEGEASIYESEWWSYRAIHG